MTIQEAAKTAIFAVGIPSGLAASRLRASYLAMACSNRSRACSLVRSV